MASSMGGFAQAQFMGVVFESKRDEQQYEAAAHQFDQLTNSDHFEDVEAFDVPRILSFVRRGIWWLRRARSD